MGVVYKSIGLDGSPNGHHCSPCYVLALGQQGHFPTILFLAKIFWELHWLMSEGRCQVAVGYMSPLLPTHQLFTCSPSHCPFPALPFHPSQPHCSFISPLQWGMSHARHYAVTQPLVRAFSSQTNWAADAFLPTLPMVEPVPWESSRPSGWEHGVEGVKPCMCQSPAHYSHRAAPLPLSEALEWCMGRRRSDVLPFTPSACRGHSILFT